MCTVVAKYFKGIGWVLAKNRDQDYVSSVAFEDEENKNTGEIILMYDHETKYKEGMNHKGLVVITTSLTPTLLGESNAKDGKDIEKALNMTDPMKAAEFETCKQNGIKDIVEVKIGYDGITMSVDKKSQLKALTRQQVYLALAKEVPDPTNTTTLIPNPYKKWKDIDKSLPDVKIEVLGPPPTSGTRDSFAELYLESGCSNYAWIKSMKDVDEKRYKRICDSIREDGAYIEAGENDNLVVQKLQSNPTSVGIFGFSYLAENQSKIRGLSIDGVDPTFETVASAKYVTSRPLFTYVKKAHIGTIPGIKEFMEEYVSDKALGSEGYLSDRGLVPLDKSALNKTKAGVKSLKNFSP